MVKFLTTAEREAQQHVWKEVNTNGPEGTMTLVSVLMVHKTLTLLANDLSRKKELMNVLNLQFFPSIAAENQHTVTYFETSPTVQLVYAKDFATSMKEQCKNLFVVILVGAVVMINGDALCG